MTMSRMGIMGNLRVAPLGSLVEFVIVSPFDAQVVTAVASQRF